MKIILIDNYDSFTFNLYHCLSSLKIKVVVRRNDEITDKQIIKDKYDRIVISPGPGNPDQSGNCIKIVKSLYKKIPILGVCLGHQIIGQVFGSNIIQAKKLMHGKTSLSKLERGLSWISLFIALAPMLGFMGTVIGMISAFDDIAEANTINASIVAGGIKIALITTVSGLIVAIILQVFYNYILSKIDGIVLDMEEASMDLVDILYKRKLQGK